jgi:hypothetical protein
MIIENVGKLSLFMASMCVCVTVTAKKGNFFYYFFFRPYYDAAL